MTSRPEDQNLTLDFLDIVATQGAYLVPRANTPVFQQLSNDPVQFATTLEMHLDALVVGQTCRSVTYHGAADEWSIGHTPTELKEKRKAELKALEELEDATTSDESDEDNSKHNASSDRPLSPRRLPIPPMSTASPPSTPHRSKRRWVPEEDEEEKEHLPKKHVSSAKDISTAVGDTAPVDVGGGERE